MRTMAAAVGEAMTGDASSSNAVLDEGVVGNNITVQDELDPIAVSDTGQSIVWGNAARFKTARSNTDVEVAQNGVVQNAVMVRCMQGMGVILVFAAVLKLLDEFVLFKVQHSNTFLLSVILDAFIGCLLVSVPNSRWTAFLGAILFASYTGYRVVNWSIPCECFGKYSYLFHDWVLLTYVLAGLALCIFACVKLRDLSFGRGRFLGTLGTVCGMLIAVLIGKAMSQGESLTAIAKDLRTTDRSGV